jgi:hypothetical protein
MSELMRLARAAAGAARERDASAANTVRPDNLRRSSDARCGWMPTDPNARAFEQRRADVVARLDATPALRYAFNVQGATPRGAALSEVSVMLGMRDAEGRIVTGELRVPADRWDMAAFLAYWDAQVSPS